MLLGSMLCDMGDQLVALCTLGPIDYFSTQAEVIRTKGDIFEKKDHKKKGMINPDNDIIETVEVKVEQPTDQTATDNKSEPVKTDRATRKLLFEEVEAWENYDKEYADKFKFNLRAYYGHKIVKETIRVLTKKTSIPTNYGPEFKQCSNAVSTKLGFCKIFVDVEDLDYEFFDFSENIKYPIILNSDIDNLKYLEKTSEEIGIDMSLLNRKNIKPGEQTFDDSSVEVVDLAEQVKTAEASGQIITVEEKDIKMVSDSEVTDEKEEDDKKIKTLLNNDNLILTDPRQSQVPTEYQKETFRKCFGEYLEGKIYDLNRLQSGEIECVVRDDEHGMFNRFWIDPGLVVGNGYNVLGRISGNDTIPVHYSEKEICKKVFSDPAYTLTPEEIQKCMTHMFLNQSIYHYIDMSNMTDRIAKLSENQFKKLGKKLTYILNSLTPEEKGRIRFSAWRNTDNFKLISDRKCKSPFPGQTCTRFSGVSVSVRGDSVKITFDNKTRQSTITNYNVL